MMVEVAVNKKLQISTGTMDLNVAFSLEQGKVLAINGPSGAGKTSLLRMIAGLMKMDRGSITVQDVTWVDTAKGVFVPPQKRKVGLLFQDYALFPNMTVLQNIRYGLQQKADEYLVNEVLEVGELIGLENKKPQELSGGQKQRVALGRALVAKPNLLLLDEPLSALDDLMREKLQFFLKKIHERYNLTTIVVTHNKSEILKLADEVFTISNGKIAYQGLPAEMFTRSAVVYPLRLVVDIVRIVPNGSSTQVEMLVGDNVLSLETDFEKTKNYQEGEKVILIAYPTHFEIAAMQG